MVHEGVDEVYREIEYLYRSTCRYYRAFQKMPRYDWSDHLLARIFIVTDV